MNWYSEKLNFKAEKLNFKGCQAGFYQHEHVFGMCNFHYHWNIFVLINGTPLSVGLSSLQT